MLNHIRENQMAWIWFSAFMVAVAIIIRGLVVSAGALNG